MLHYIYKCYIRLYFHHTVCGIHTHSANFRVMSIVQVEKLIPAKAWAWQKKQPAASGKQSWNQTLSSSDGPLHQEAAKMSSSFSKSMLIQWPQTWLTSRWMRNAWKKAKTTQSTKRGKDSQHVEKWFILKTAWDCMDVSENNGTPL